MVDAGGVLDQGCMNRDDRSVSQLFFYLCDHTCFSTLRLRVKYATTINNSSLADQIKSG